MAVEISVIDFVEKFVETTDNRRLPIADLFDGCGLSTCNPKNAVLCLAGVPGAWISLRLSDFDPRRLQ